MGNSQAESQHGDVVLTIGDGSPATLVASTKDGTLRSAYPPQSKSPKRLTALVAGGGPGIQLRAHKGDVQIHKGK